MRDYVIRIRRGKEIRVDKQILRWRRRRKAEAKKLQREAEARAMPDILPVGRELPNIFGSDNE